MAPTVRQGVTLPFLGKLALERDTRRLAYAPGAAQSGVPLRSRRPVRALDHTIDLNYVAVAHGAGLSKDTVRLALLSMLSLLAERIAQGRDARVVLDRLGTLAASGGSVLFTPVPAHCGVAVGSPAALVR